MFADDTNLFFLNKDLSDLYQKGNNELAKVSTWFKLNKLSLDIKKLIIFYLRIMKNINK